jgi:hypothetical protein
LRILLLHSFQVSLFGTAFSQNDVFRNRFYRAQVRIFAWPDKSRLNQSSALVAASPTAPPAKFAIQVTANGETLFLGKAVAGTPIKGLPVKDKAQAAACSIANEVLSCDGQMIGINRPNMVDMVPIEAANATLTPITKGFSIGVDNKLHFKSDEFKKMIQHENIEKLQGGEAQFGTFNDILTFGQTLLFLQLGCPGGTHQLGPLAKGLHAMVRIGTGVAIPL